MAIQNMTVVLDDSVQSENRLTCAISLAREHRAFLTGLCATSMFRTVKAEPERGAFAETGTNAAEIGEQLAAMFRDRIRFGRVQGEWRIASDPLTDSAVRHARLSDLFVLGQIDPGHPPPAGRHLLEDVLLTSGRPILVVPYAGQYNTVGTNVLVAWKDSREAVRAMHDALPCLVKAASVTLLHAFTAGRKGPDESVTAGIARYLSRHGVDARVARFPMAGISVPDAMLSYAADIGADLLVAGGYGHSRLREFALGGVTRGLLQQMTVPVLMSH